jgi:DNA polymerase-3 subunit alpha
VVLIQGNGAREIEIQLKGRYKVSPAIANAIKAVPGVVQVQLS